jgi:hypothetical protein
MGPGDDIKQRLTVVLAVLHRHHKGHKHDRHEDTNLTRLVPLDRPLTYRALDEPRM